MERANCGPGGALPFAWSHADGAGCGATRRHLGTPGNGCMGPESSAMHHGAEYGYLSLDHALIGSDTRIFGQFEWDQGLFPMVGGSD